MGEGLPGKWCLSHDVTRTGLQGGDAVGAGLTGPQGPCLTLGNPKGPQHEPLQGDRRERRGGRGMTHLGVLGGKEQGLEGGRRPWKEWVHGGPSPLLPSAARLLHWGFLGALGWGGHAEVHFHPCNPPRVISSPRSPTSRVQTPFPSDEPTASGRCMWAPVWLRPGVRPALSWAWLEEGPGCRPSCCLVGSEFPPQPEWTQGPRGPEASHALRAGRGPPIGKGARMLPIQWAECCPGAEMGAAAGAQLFLRAQLCPQGPLGDGGLCGEV